MRMLIRTLACLWALAAAPWAFAHAFPDKSAPSPDATVSAAPREVKVWFTGDIEPGFSTLVVKSVTGQQVSSGKGHVDSDNHTLLETALPDPLPAGSYVVDWSVVARDGHHTAGHFEFKVR